MAQATVLTSVEFRFRGKPVIDPETKKPKVDEKGAKIMVKDRENFELQVPYLTIDGIQLLLQEGNDKEKDAVLSAVNQIIFNQAKRQVDEGVAVQTDLDLSKLDWKYIAELSASDLTESTAPTKEMLEAMVADYVAVMPAAVGISTESAKTAGKEFQAKFRNVKLRTDLVEKLLSRLTQWYQATEKQEEFADTFEWLANKATSYIEEAKKAGANDIY